MKGVDILVTQFMSLKWTTKRNIVFVFLKFGKELILSSCILYNIPERGKTNRRTKKSYKITHIVTLSVLFSSLASSAMTVIARACGQSWPITRLLRSCLSAAGCPRRPCSWSAATRRQLRRPWARGRSSGRAPRHWRHCWKKTTSRRMGRTSSGRMPLRRWCRMVGVCHKMVVLFVYLFHALIYNCHGWLGVKKSGVRLSHFLPFARHL